MANVCSRDEDVNEDSFESFNTVSGVFCGGMKHLTPGPRSRNGLSTSPDGSQTMLSTVSLLSYVLVVLISILK